MNLRKSLIAVAYVLKVAYGCIGLEKQIKDRTVIFKKTLKKQIKVGHNDVYFGTLGMVYMESFVV